MEMFWRDLLTGLASRWHAARPAMPEKRSFLQRLGARDRHLRLCETLPLGGRRALALVECDGERFLAGLSSNGVETLVRVHAAAGEESR